MEIENLDYANDIITKLKEFLEPKAEISENWMVEFGNWLNVSLEENKKNNHVDDEYTDIIIGMKLINSSTIVKSILNKFINNSPFASFMDYQFLYILKEHGEMTKSDLISYNYMEMSSGIEVIKRLLKCELINDKINPNDRRSKLIYITSNGGHLIDKYKDAAQDIYTSFSKSLDKSKKNIFLELLSQINLGKD